MLTGDTGAWDVSLTTNPLDDSTTVALALASNDGHGTFGQPVMLFIRCKSGTPEVFISWNAFLGSDHATVTHRIGEAEAVVKRWSLSTDHTASFLPAQLPVQAFIDDIAAADRFVAQVTPYSESPITAIFEVNGLAQAVSTFREVCPLRPPPAPATVYRYYGPALRPGTKIRILDVHPEDSYYPDREAIVGVECLTVQFERTGGADKERWYGGDAYCDGQSYYFYKVAVGKL